MVVSGTNGKAAVAAGADGLMIRSAQQSGEGTV